MVTAEQLDAFATAFAALGKLHRDAPDPPTLAAFRELQEEWPLPETASARGGLAAPDNPAADGGLAALRRSAELGEDAEQIADDHNRLYGDSARALVPPYESVHRGIDKLVFDDATIEVRAAYRELGLRAPRLNREPDDHLGLEFDFVAQALLRACDATADGDTAGAARLLDLVRDFIADHLARWAPGMLAAVVGAARTQFMVGVARLSLATLDQASAALGVPADER